MKGLPFINTPIHRGGPGHSNNFQPFQWFPGFHEYARRSTPNRQGAELQRLLDVYPQLIHHQFALVTMSLANPIRSALASATLLCAATQCLAQGTVTFDGPPAQPRGTANLVQSYNLNPNRTWRLYIVDDRGQRSGSISGSWCLTLYP